MEQRMTLADLIQLMADCAAAQEETTAVWHDETPGGDLVLGEGPRARVLALCLGEHRANFRLWHVEDDARRRDVDAAVIADCKRRIDALNQERNDCIERLDETLVALLAPLMPRPAPGVVPRHNTESAGMALDRLSILALKVFHMEEQTRRRDVDDAHRTACARKLAVLREQRSDLLRALQDLLAEYAEGRKQPKVYFQFKMYNDPALNPALYGPVQK